MVIFSILGFSLVIPIFDRKPETSFVSQLETESEPLAADTGWETADHVEDNNAVGTITWSDPTDAKTDDGNYATAMSMADGAISHYLWFNNFGFSIPSDATIDGIEVKINKYAQYNTATEFVKDNDLYLIDETNNTCGNDKADTSTKWSTNSGTEVTYGSSSDTWNSGLTAANINDADFGVALSALVDGEGGMPPTPETANVDYIAIKVYYTEAADDDTTHLYPTDDSNNGWDDPSNLVDGSRTTFAGSTDNGDEIFLRNPLNQDFSLFPDKPIKTVSLNLTGKYVSGTSTGRVNVTVSFDNGNTYSDIYEFTLDTTAAKSSSLSITTDSIWDMDNITWYDITRTIIRCVSNLTGGSRVQVSYIGLEITHDFWSQPLINATIPFDGERNVSTSLSTVSITLNSTKGNFNYSIEGSFLTDTSANNQGDNTYTATINSLSDNTDYTWYVNVSDYDDSTNYTQNYTFYFDTKDVIEYDLLILTASANYTVAKNFSDWKESETDYECNVVNLTDFNTNSKYWLNGSYGDNNPANPYYVKQSMRNYSIYNTSQDFVRNYIRDQVENYNISYVIIFGGKFPYKEMTLFEDGNDIVRPTDTLWYAMLNGTQNTYDWHQHDTPAYYDKMWGFRINSNWCSENIDTLSDKVMDVIVGRFPGYNSTELWNIVNKTKNYVSIESNDEYCKTYIFYSENLTGGTTGYDNDRAWTDATWGLNNSYLNNIESDLIFVNGTGQTPGQTGQFDNCITQEQVNNSLFDIFNCTNATHPHSAIIYHYHTHGSYGYPKCGYASGNKGNLSTLQNNTYPFIQPPFSCNQGNWIDSFENRPTDGSLSSQIMRQQGGSVVVTGSTSFQCGEDGYLEFFNGLLQNSSTKTLSEIWVDYYIDYAMVSNDEEMWFNQYLGDPTLSFKGYTPVSIDYILPSNESFIDSFSKTIVNLSYVGGTINVYWLSNSLGSWQQYGANLSVDMSSGWANLSQTNSNFTNGKYYWSINISYGSQWLNETYWFIANNLPTITNPIPTNGSIDQSLTPTLSADVGDLDFMGEYHTNWDNYCMNSTRQGHQPTCDFAPIENTVLWSSSFGSGNDNFAGPIVHDGLVYMNGKGANDNLYCFYLNNGTEKWNTSTGDVDDTPTYYDEYVYVLTGENDVQLTLFKINSLTGVEDWHFNLPYDQGSNYSGSPAIGATENMVYAVGARVVYGINITTGVMEWHRNESDEGTSASSPTYHDGELIVPFTMDTIIYNAVTGVVNHDSVGQAWDSSPTVVENMAGFHGAIYLGQHQYNWGVRYANLTSGAHRWVWQPNGDANLKEVFSTIAYHDNKLFFGMTSNAGNVKVYCINATHDTLSYSDREIWSYTVDAAGNDDVYSSIAISNGFVYFGALTNKVYCLYENNGTEKWTYTLPGNIYSQPAIADGILLIGCDNGLLYAFGDLSQYNKTLGGEGNQKLNVSWYWNDSGNWYNFANDYNLTANQTVSHSFPNATGYNTIYYWSVNVTDGIDWANATYHFTTKEREPVLANTYTFDFGNDTLTPILANTYTFDFGNDTIIPVLESTYTFDFGNDTLTPVLEDTITFDFGNETSLNWQLSDTYTFDFGNDTLTPILVDTITFDFGNNTIIPVLEDTITFDFGNDTLTPVLEDTITFDFGNETGFNWQLADTYTFDFGNDTLTPILANTYTFDFGNDTLIPILESTYTFDFGNDSLSPILANTYTFDFGNDTIIPFLANTYTFDFGNDTLTPVLEDTITFDFGNETIGEQWNLADTYTFDFGNDSLSSILDNTYTFDFGNGTLGPILEDTISFDFGNETIGITVSNEFPGDETYIQSLQPTVYFTITNPYGRVMNYTIYIGNSSANTTTVLDTGVNVTNGTYYYNNYYTASNYTEYHWRVYVNDSIIDANETFKFTTNRAGGGIVGSNSGAIAIAAAGMMIGVIALVFAFNKRRRKINEKE